MNKGSLPIHGPSAGLPAASISSKSSEGNIILPITLYINNVQILTTGVPQDIATIQVPAGITRWHIFSSTSASGSFIVTETSAGTLAAASFTAYDGPAATGVQLTLATTAPATAGLGVPMVYNNANVLSTGKTIYIRQTANSANVGTCSFYFTIFPLP